MNVWTLPALIFLMMFLAVNFVVWMFKVMGKLTAALLRKAFSLSMPENERRWLERLFTPIWIAVGIWAFLKLKNESLLVALFGLFSFRSGGNTAKTIVYSLHDRRLVKKLGDGGLLSRVTAAVITLEMMFFIGMALAYKAVSVVAGSSAWLFYLWFGGLAFGLLFFSIVARNNDGVLMKNVLSIAVFFSGRKGMESVERLKARGIENGGFERMRKGGERLKGWKR